MNLKTVIEDSDSGPGRTFALFIQFLIVLSLVSFSIATLPDLSPETQALLRYTEVFTVIVFTVEYVLRIYVADKPLRYIFSFYGIIDLCAILPFYLPGQTDLRALRAFRLLRLARILKLVRYHRAVRRFHKAYLLAKDEAVLFLCLTLILLYLAAVGIYYFENPVQPDVFASVFHGLWWAIATLTTVGYGDIYPITVGGKIFTFFVLIIGLGVVAIPAGMVATALSKAREDEDDAT